MRSLFTLVLSIALTNCAGGQGDRAVAPNEQVATNVGSTKTLVYGSGGQPVTLEPGNITDGNSVIVQDQIYNRLMGFKPGTMELQPPLATRWVVSPDGKT